MESDLLWLLSAWLGQEVEPDRREGVLARLSQDVAFRRAFVAEVRMLGMLKIVQSPEPRWLRLEDELGWSASESPAPATLEDQIMRRLDDAPRRRVGGRARWAVAAALVLAVAAIAATLSVSLFDRSPNGQLAPQVADIQPYPRVDTANGLAMVVGLDRVAWDPAGGPHPVEGDVLAPGRLQFGSGRALLSMLTGVVLDVEGPADFDLLDSNRVFCRRGRTRARVPAGAEGFVVLGPSSAVVDLGTEFGLNVEPDGKSRGTVFRGKLEASLLSESGTPQRTFVMDAAEEPFRKAFEIDSRAGSIAAVATSDDFIAASHPVSPPLELDTGYADAVRRAKPWGYWRFDAIEGGSVPNDVSGRPPLRVTGPIRLGTAPGGNRWAEFHPTRAPQFLELDRPWHPTWRPGFAVEFWYASESIAHASLASLLVGSKSRPHLFLVESTARSRLTMHKPASVRLLHRWPPRSERVDDTYSQDPYIPYRWHYVVGQINGDHMEVFLDGQLTSSLSISPEHGDVPCLFLLGRLTKLAGSNPSSQRPFVGRMDEVALYDRPLTAEEVRHHHRLGFRTSPTR